MFGLIWIIATLVSMCLVYNDAKSRMSSHPVLWTAGVFLCFIIFLPLYLLMRPSETTGANRKSMLYPHCEKYYEPPAQFCPNCGNKIAANVS